ncbi:hypothetical protein PUNSTDRAFT_129779 [Punctularia strigosozonata HHB-11173 SS5]|uniref:uncharacterized protein n=1 Tax=Punctularia strigosozonata (strain HHB-11173) TaxID=741275 RepID=UPI00044177A4|nr:uncharacterized protein PUNSTDRAFT_129779 [Punctularia strigosozonata HHB-11173 SS5]EIN14143.1 hypothetical protein PUNSTDRAFT_129779 [Punctularia strigosozonata HHB-11173 SS5]
MAVETTAIISCRSGSVGGGTDAICRAAKRSDIWEWWSSFAALATWFASAAPGVAVYDPRLVVATKCIIIATLACVLATCHWLASTSCGIVVVNALQLLQMPDAIAVYDSFVITTDRFVITLLQRFLTCKLVMWFASVA